MSRAVGIALMVTILAFSCLAMGASAQTSTRARRALYVVLVIFLTGFTNGFVREAAQ